ncbi:hypothetical protein MD535_16460 [Vibrio sp. ZSDZ65]|uniref:Uncharacterized protein n=1 Tax=Vibrio qingdaonensis TaxID=2829491 RepID=A0A9X3CSD1_9VIBR|nr:hypothetical protein [Vibrio qingdaonensis]MCW8347595.1 hypothetical protein [Vibrio qingdaonensis]
MKTDFQFTLALVEDFFQQPAIQSRLQLITQHRITGWEIWLQVEFACFIDTYPEIGNWYRECQYDIDKRRSNTRKSMAIDFAFRRKHTNKDKYIALEVKQSLSTTQCIHNLFKDVEKVWHMKSSEDDLRSMWCLGIHPSSSQVEVRNTVMKYAKKYDFELDNGCIEYQLIEGTDWGFTLF